MSAIGVDYTPAVEQGGGIGRYVRELLAALSVLDAETRYKLFVAGISPEALPEAPGPNFSWRASRISPKNFARIWHRLGLPIPIEVWSGPLALFHATDFVLPPVMRGTVTFLTVHDLSFIRAPETASPRLRAYLSRAVPRSVRRADLVLADSQATKDDLIELYGVASEKITVLYSGVDPRFHPADRAVQESVRARYGLDFPYVLAVGTVQPRKNYARLIQALAALPGPLADIHLVIAGGRGWLEGPIYETAHLAGVEERVHFIGFVPDDDLPALYTAAEAFAFPSLYEGFGLPLLEAMACGTPSLAANTSSLPEVAGDAALLIDPTSVDSIATGLERILTDNGLRSTLRERGFARAGMFTWERAARHLLTLYREWSRD